MMSFNSFPASALRTWLHGNPSVAPHKRNDALSVFTSAKPFVGFQRVIPRSHVQASFHFQVLFVSLSILTVVRAIFCRSLIAAARYAVLLGAAVSTLVGTFHGAPRWHHPKVSAMLFDLWFSLPDAAIRLNASTNFGRLLVFPDARLTPISQSAWVRS